ncbi:hypothetical protein [Litorimonas haliclonae]|uniref:hypothetical protein n=1 Tax=Litorimonas haliclonae TaxID=2081977 RepID=UPI0039EED78D
MPKGCICKIEGCFKPKRRREWCGAHYERWRKYGDPLASKHASPGEPLSFLMETVATPPDVCVIWPYAIGTHGYGVLSIDGHIVTAPKEALIRFVGPAPSANSVCAHKPRVCHNRKCINPKHLRWATNIENNADRVLDGTDNRGERHGCAKLTEVDVRAIRVMDGTHSEIAKMFGVSRQTVGEIKRRQSWTWLD